MVNCCPHLCHEGEQGAQTSPTQAVTRAPRPAYVRQGLVKSQDFCPTTVMHPTKVSVETTWAPWASTHTHH